MEAYFNMITVVSRLISSQSSSLIVQPLHINLTVYNTIVETFSFRKDHSILCDHILTAKDQILCGLTFSCICIYISAHQTCRLSGNKISAVAVLSDHLIAG